MIQVLTYICIYVILFGNISADNGKYCFRNRTPIGNLGKCDDIIQFNTTRQQCCALGGRGWTLKSNGKRCDSACVSQSSESMLEDLLIKRCYSNRNVSRNMGTCTDFIGEKTQEACCQQGGHGWTTRNNGKRCIDPCNEGIGNDPVQFCFNHRTIRNGNFKCKNLLGQMTRLTCCQMGGDGWGPNNNGRRCQSTCEEEHEVQEPVNGGWGSWILDRPCNATCRTGNNIYRSLIRMCDNPPPQFGGLPCSGSPQEYELCTNLPHCPIHGAWSDWDEWGACSSPQCDTSGIRYRSRTCTNPKPKYGGNYCFGSIVDRGDCVNLCSEDELQPVNRTLSCDYGYECTYEAFTIIDLEVELLVPSENISDDNSVNEAEPILDDHVDDYESDSYSF